VLVVDVRDFDGLGAEALAPPAKTSSPGEDL
jgi:hypothetical protein